MPASGAPGRSRGAVPERRRTRSDGALLGEEGRSRAASKRREHWHTVHRVGRRPIPSERCTQSQQTHHPVHITCSFLRALGATRCNELRVGRRGGVARTATPRDEGTLILRHSSVKHIRTKFPSRHPESKKSVPWFSHSGLPSGGIQLTGIAFRHRLHLSLRFPSRHCLGLIFAGRMCRQVHAIVDML